MYQGNNPTALRSQKWLAESLIRLLYKKPFAQIMVKDIYTQADLSRQTFYNLFDSKEEVLRYYLRTLYLPFLQWLQAQENPELENATGRLIQILDENKQIVSILIENHLETMLLEGTIYVVDTLSKRLLHTVQKSKTLPFMIALVSGAIVNAIVFWVKEGMPISTTELNEIIQKFLHKVYSSEL